MRDFWKLPGGMVDRGENVHQAVVREVFEETGVRTQFSAVASFRESHEAPFGNTDLYFVCVVRLHPSHHAPPSDPVPVPCELEVERAAWMPVEEFMGGKLYRTGLLRELMQSAVDVARGESGGLQQQNVRFMNRGFVSAYRPRSSKL
ncbi:Nudix hydrolase 2 [Diplonema papillatum]|nr:Nudix hydrolase 2 [Diplonema papillatum]